MNQRLLGPPLRLPLPAGVLEIPHQLLPLGIDRHHRLTALQTLIRLRIDMFELSVAVRVRRPFAALAHRLQPIAKLVQQSAHRRRAHLPARARQRRGELRPTLARPPQRGLRVAAGQRVNQLLQRLLDARLGLLDVGASRARAADSTELGAARFQLPAPLADSRTRQSGRIRHQRIASIPDGTRFRGRPYTTPALIEKRLDRRVLLNDRRFELKIASHRGIRTQSLKDGNVI